MRMSEGLSSWGAVCLEMSDLFLDATVDFLDRDVAREMECASYCDIVDVLCYWEGGRGQWHYGW